MYVRALAEKRVGHVTPANGSVDVTNATFVQLDSVIDHERKRWTEPPGAMLPAFN